MCWTDGMTLMRCDACAWLSLPWWSFGIWWRGYGLWAGRGSNPRPLGSLNDSLYALSLSSTSDMSASLELSVNVLPFP